MAALFLLPLSFASNRGTRPELTSQTRSKFYHRVSASKPGNGAGGSRTAPNQEKNQMEQYLESLSLEYESVWDTKPSWCQPWSIILTGMLVIAGSWLVFHSAPLTFFAGLVISAWWFVFLYSYPLEYAQMIAERRKRVEEGDEDTFGMPQ